RFVGSVAAIRHPRHRLAQGLDGRIPCRLCHHRTAGVRHARSRLSGLRTAWPEAAPARVTIGRMTDVCTHLDRDDRVKLGAYYTPDDLVARVHDLIAPYGGRTGTRSVVFDPAAGYGAF